MRFSSMIALLFAAALTGVPVVTAVAEPIPASSPAHPSGTARTPSPAPTSDAAQYAARETRDRAVADFKGGSEVMVITSGTVAVVLLVVILVLIL